MNADQLKSIPRGTPLPWSTWILRELVLRPESFYDRAERDAWVRGIAEAGNAPKPAKTSKRVAR